LFINKLRPILSGDECPAILFYSNHYKKSRGYRFSCWVLLSFSNDEYDTVCCLSSPKIYSSPDRVYYVFYCSTSKTGSEEWERNDILNLIFNSNERTVILYTTP